QSPATTPFAYPTLFRSLKPFVILSLSKDVLKLAVLRSGPPIPSCCGMERQSLLPIPKIPQVPGIVIHRCVIDTMIGEYQQLAIWFEGLEGCAIAHRHMQYLL